MAKRFYTVKAGESLSIIARDQLGELARWRELAYINEIASPYTIRTGQTIMLPVDTYPLQVTITEGIPAPIDGAAAVKKAAFELTPATLAIFGIAAVAVFLLMEQK